jgi:ABC-2 type transport system permease protein
MNVRRAIKGIYALWYREFKVFIREKSRVISSIFLPLFWYFIFGAGLGSITTQTNYQQFIFPGFLAMTIIFTSSFNGAYLVWDKKIDFLKEVLVTPLSRTTIFFGKVLGGITDSVLQALILLIIGIFFLGMPFTVYSVILTIIMMVVLAIGLVSFGLIIGSFMESPEGFGLVASFVVYPLFLLSGALYPVDNLPHWMKLLTMIDPASYAVDGMRAIMVGTSSMSYGTNLLIILAFDIFLIIVGTWAFNRMKL